jgi:FAD-dependent urate hydroxylase
VSRVHVAIVGAGAYGLSLAAHLEAMRINYRIFGRPMQFWSNVAAAGDGRYLKSFCFGADLSTPRPGFSFADFSRPRGLETFEPCLMRDFASYGLWFQEQIVPRVEATDVVNLQRVENVFSITLSSGEQVTADSVVIATGLTNFAQIPSVLRSLPNGVVTHTSEIRMFSEFKGLSVAVVGAGQSALEAAALLLEAGAEPQLVVRKSAILWQSRIAQKRSLWRHVRSPITRLGTGPKAWLLTQIPGAAHRLPENLRTQLVKRHLPPEGAWWLRDRVEGKMTVHLETTVAGVQWNGSRVVLKLHAKDGERESELQIDRVVAGTGYRIDLEQMTFIDPELRRGIHLIERAPRLHAAFESSVGKLYFVGPASAMSFGPLFRFVAGAEYTARRVSAHLAETFKQKVSVPLTHPIR